MFCETAKEFLSQRDVPFVERDVARDPDALKEFLKMGVMTTPIIVVDGEVVVGFDQARLTELLGDS